MGQSSSNGKLKDIRRIKGLLPNGGITESLPGRDGKSSAIENILNLCAKDESSTVSHLLSQIQDLQDQVNAMNETEVYDPETAGSNGMSHIPESQYVQPQFWIAALITEFDGYFMKFF